MNLGNSTADTTWDPAFGPYNVLYCRPGTYLSFSTEETNANGIVVAMNIKFYSGFSGMENLFSIRDSTNHFESLAVELNTTSSQIQIGQQFSNGTWIYVLNTSAITYGK
jgi:hypothetical protein